MVENTLNLPDLPAQTRLTSIDVFRGLTMVIMIFVNALSEGSFTISDIPAWLRHANPPNTITFVDVIFPVFIFIVGLCIPITLSRRLDKSKSQVQIWAHILTRTIILMIMGITMGNLWYARGDPYAVMIMGNLWNLQPAGRPLGMSINLWGVLLFISFFLIWSRYPESKGFKRTVFAATRISGVVLLAYLLVVFRRDEDLGWLKFGEWGFWSWWILGIIGWSYLVSCIIYMSFRRQPAGVMGCLGLLIFIYIGDSVGVFNRFHFLDGVRHYVPFGPLLGSWPSMSTAGAIVGMLYIGNSPAQTAHKRIMWIIAFAAGLFIAGFLLCPIYGISSGEGRATPTWALYSSAISCVIFAFLYLLLDVWGKKRWASFILPIGANALLVYLLSRMIHPLFGLLHLDFINRYFNSGMPGILRTAILTALLVLFSRWLTTRFRIELKL
jgi:heparan-alpha-glucosaminide N-acetyltransferase